MDFIIMIVAFGAIMYFLMIRPQQKRAKEHQALIASIEAGTRVLLTSGIFATVVHTGERQMIVELAPGVEITVLKGNVARVVGDSDEEFVFTDDLPEDTEAPEDDVASNDLDRFEEITANFESNETRVSDEPVIDEAPEAPADRATDNTDENNK